MNITHNLKGKFRGWTPLIVIAVVLAILPLMGASRFLLLFMYVFFLYFSMASMWNLLAGYSGLISLCQPAFVGLAGYSLAIFTWWGLSLYLSMIVGAVVAGIFALLISALVFRMKGIYFAIGTLTLPEALRIFFLIWEPKGVGGPLQGGGSGYTILGTTTLSTTQTYWMALAIGIVAFVIVGAIIRSKLGLGLAGIRDSDRTAATSAVNIFKVKLTVFIIAAVVTGLAGAIFYAGELFIEPYGAFNIKWTMIVVLATVIGGMRTEIGPVVGAIIVTIMHFELARYGSISLVLQGAILLCIMLLAPEGIVGYIGKIKGRIAYRSMSENLKSRSDVVSQR